MSFLTSVFKKKDGTTSVESALILSDVLETIREGVLIINGNTEIVASNRSAYEYFGRGNGPLNGRRLSEVIREVSVHSAFRNALLNMESSEIRFEFLDKERKVFAVRVVPFRHEGESQAIGTFYDLTKIEQLENVRQEFLSNVSHELRTPLTSILAYVETLEDGALEDEENNRRFLGIIRSNAERMQFLINDILELSAIEAGKIEVERSRVRLASLIESVFVNLKGKAASRSISLFNEVEPEVEVFADPIRLDQILTNLIDNAVKFNREGRSVRVTCETNATGHLIRVHDEGDGISAEHLPRLFERFYRTDRARSREIGGTGLGLAIVKHLARLHGGEVSVSSTPGTGSVFSVELPYGAQ
jgi:two-component system phosphate regulon sensor histidine kinase PhoR